MYYIEDNTMEKLNIIDKKIIDSAIKEAVNCVRRFTKKELYQLIKKGKNNPKPLIIPVGDIGLIVGEYAIKSYHDRYYLTFIYDLEREKSFSSRNVAVLYALSQTRKNYQLADSILKYDDETTRLQQEVTLYEGKSRRALKQKNIIDFNIYEGRLTETRYLLATKQRLLAKSLKMAKYFYL